MMDWKEVEKFFLEASAAAYAAGAKPATIAALPGSKVLTFKRPPFQYVDTYFTSPVGVSFGWTLIYHEAMLPHPIWWLRYDGWYERGDDRITAFLRLALSAAYRSGEFIGGRGPAVFTAPEFPGLIYYNGVAEKDFAHPSGRDKIVIDVREANEGRRERYWHAYRGGLLVPM